MTKEMELIIIVAIAIIIFATLGFYILIYYRFTSFINQDRDRINAFSEVCFQNLKDNTFNENKAPEKENISNLPDVVSNDVAKIEEENSIDNNTIDNF